MQSILRLSSNSAQRAESPMQEFHLIGFKGIPEAGAYIMVSEEREWSGGRMRVGEGEREMYDEKEKGDAEGRI